MKIRIMNKDKRIAFYFVKKKATNKKCVYCNSRRIRTI
nr:MAG TPA: hypothetical protein [Microviridae sp.]